MSRFRRRPPEREPDDQFNVPLSRFLSELLGAQRALGRTVSGASSMPARRNVAISGSRWRSVVFCHHLPNFLCRRRAFLRRHHLLLVGIVRFPLPYVAAKWPGWRGGADGDEAKAHERLLALPLAKIDVAQIDVAAVTAALATWKDERATQGKMVVKIRSVLTFAKEKNWPVSVRLRAGCW